jgi:hypothetical protein
LNRKKIVVGVIGLAAAALIISALMKKRMKGKISGGV